MRLAHVVTNHTNNITNIRARVEEKYQFSHDLAIVGDVNGRCMGLSRERMPEREWNIFSVGVTHPRFLEKLLNVGPLVKKNSWDA